MPPSSQRPASTLTGAPSPQHRGPSVRPRPDPGQQETRLRTCAKKPQPLMPTVPGGRMGASRPRGTFPPHGPVRSGRTRTHGRRRTRNGPPGPGAGRPLTTPRPGSGDGVRFPFRPARPGPRGAARGVLLAGCRSRGALRPPPVSSPLCSNDFLRRLRRLRLHPGPGCRGSCDPADPEVTASLGKLARLPSACVPRPPLVPWALTHRTKTLKIIVTLPESQGVHPRPQGNRCHRRTFGPLFLPAEPLPLQRPVGYPEALPSHLGWWRTEDSRLRGAAQGAPPSPQAILRTPFCKAGRQGFQEPLHRYSHFQELRLEWAWGKAQRGQSGLLGVPCAV
ncbi:translation initiation factor IF-2-like [Canis lupus dingo]|uniref:translation initiation factor IF-2-like n=1 Tax=Canis lupus dingo TaxID=286419 RepID=UPI0020C2EECD|nr:translation initiation factor IF-2-like [Canis lupus dingo]